MLKSQVASPEKGTSGDSRREFRRGFLVADLRCLQLEHDWRGPCAINATAGLAIGRRNKRPGSTRRSRAGLVLAARERDVRDVFPGRRGSVCLTTNIRPDP
jgi:hypothetical protein